MQKIIIRLHIFIFFILIVFYSCNKEYKLIQEDIHTDILSFYLTDGLNKFESFEINDSMIFVNVPNQGDFHKLRAVFSHNGQSVYLNGIKQYSDKTVNDFSDFTKPLTYTVESSLGESRNYTVCLFDLPVVIINTEEGKSILDKETWIPSSVKILDTNGSVLLDDSLKIKGRGNGSWRLENYLKKSYSLKFGKKKEVLEMPKHKRWVLLGHSGDWTKVRTPFCFKLSELSGMKWVPRGRNVEFILNGKILCNYYLCEQIKVDKNRIDITEMTPADTIGESVTGGVLFEVSDSYDEEYKFRTNYSLPYMLRNPDENVQPQQMSYFTSFIDSLEHTLMEADRLANNEFLKYMDIDSYIQWWIVNEVIVTMEETYAGKNFFMYKDRGYDEKLHAGPPWDFDWGTFWKSQTERWICKDAHYYGRLFKNSLFVNRVKEIWNEVKNRYENETEEYIKELMLKNRNSVLRDQIMYPVVNENEDNDMKYEEAIDYIFNVFKFRVNWLDEKINAL